MQIITPLMGASFRPAHVQDIIRSLTSGDVLELERDPSNQYDSFAVKVMLDGEHLGFVSKDMNYELFNHLTALEANEVDPRDYPVAVCLSFENSLKPILEINFDDSAA